MPDTDPNPLTHSKAEIAIVMGSDSDLRVMGAAVEVLKEFGVNFHVQVLSAHRTPFDMLAFADRARENGFKVIIAGAGGAAHLPGMVASATSLPVIGVPIKLAALEGIDSLLSIVQMPSGVPVATVGVDNSKNAALLALRILSIADSELTTKLDRYRDSLADASRLKKVQY